MCLPSNIDQQSSNICKQFGAKDPDENKENQTAPRREVFPRPADFGSRASVPSRSERFPGPRCDLQEQQRQWCEGSGSVPARSARQIRDWHMSIQRGARRCSWRMEKHQNMFKEGEEELSETNVDQKEKAVL